ncbi:hypothetical protein [Haloferula sp.]|uniref:hypothetical protein n=1 Tax=Haloferula sp. TaxID=2497595 RepID=UPI00329B59C2
MKLNLPTSLLAAVFFASPNISIAGAEPTNVVRIDSDLTFSLRITAEGEEVERNGRVISRFQTSRMGPREVLAALEELPRAVPTAEEGEEGRVLEPFPNGSRLVATPDRGVWVVDRNGFAIFDAQPYVSVSIDREDGVIAYNVLESGDDSQIVSVTILGLNINLPVGMVAVGLETAEPDANNTYVYGTVRENYNMRTSSRGVTETVTVSGNATGTGHRPGLGQIVASGSVRMRGRNVTEPVEVD